MSIKHLFQNTKVIPVVVINNVDHAIPLANALLGAGVSVVEITLRTHAALDAISRISRECPAIAVGAGSVTRPEQVADIIDSGAAFAVSPGFSESLLSVIETEQLPYIPGSATASETLHLRDRGYTVQKFFPAEQVGGTSYLQSLAGPIDDVKFVPTGGINVGNADKYLALSNVLCLGGSWVAPASLLDGGEFEAIANLAREAAGIMA